jgi:protein-disulfide isomerase
VTRLVKERLVAPGLVRYVHFDFPLTGIHQHAFVAARAARCALDQERFWPYHDMLHARQPTWAALRDPTGFFVELADELHLNRGDFSSCLRSDRHAAEVTRSLRLGESLGVQGTPTLFVNGRRIDGGPGFTELERIVRDEAGAAAAAAGR